MATGFPCDIPGEFLSSLPGYLNMQWRINWGTTQSKPSTTPRQRMYASGFLLGRLCYLLGISRLIQAMRLVLVGGSWWFYIGRSSSVCSLQPPQGISGCDEGLGPGSDFAR